MDEALQEKRRHKAESIRRAEEVLAAIRADDVSRVEALLAAGADANASVQGERLIVSATRQQPIPKLVLLRALLKAGADPNAGAPLHCVAAQGDLEATSLLLAFGARHDRRAFTEGDPRGGRLPLSYPALFGHVDVARLLLDAGADVNGRSVIYVNGKRKVRDVTPLMLAAGERYLKVVNLLLERGADPTLVDSRGFTALASVKGKSKNADRVRERLRTAMSKVSEVAGGNGDLPPA